MDAPVRIPVHPNQYALVDRADAVEVEQYRWHARITQSGTICVLANIVKNGKQRIIYLARLIGRPRRSQVVTFRNEDPLD